MNTALVHHSQYVTATDRVLAAGRITKRRGPHTMHQPFEYTPPQYDEATMYVHARPRRARSASRVVAAAAALLLAGGLAGARIAHASSRPRVTAHR
jgi:hypothetical protein